MKTLLTQRGVVTLGLILLGKTVISYPWYEVCGESKLQTIARDYLSWGIVISIISRRSLPMIILTTLRYLRFFSFGFFLE
jgi:hypothetical protein